MMVIYSGMVVLYSNLSILCGMWLAFPLSLLTLYILYNYVVYRFTKSTLDVAVITKKAYISPQP